MIYHVACRAENIYYLVMYTKFPAPWYIVKVKIHGKKPKWPPSMPYIKKNVWKRKICNVLGENENEGTENYHGEEQRGNTRNNKEDVSKLQSLPSVVAQRRMGVGVTRTQEFECLGKVKENMRTYNYYNLKNVFPCYALKYYCKFHLQEEYEKAEVHWSLFPMWLYFWLF